MYPDIELMVDYSIPYGSNADFPKPVADKASVTSLNSYPILQQLFGKDGQVNKKHRIKSGVSRFFCIIVYHHMMVMMKIE